MRRGEFARWAAPAAFLVAATIAILLIRAGLHGGDVAPGTTAPTTRAQPETRAAGTTTTQRPVTITTELRAEYYEVESGDTLAGIAAEHDTNVERLLELNPDVDPRTLRVGQRVRVR